MTNLKNYEGNLTDAAKAANSVESANQKNGEPARQQRSRAAKSKFWPVITKAKRTFYAQLHKNNEVKRECIEQLIPTITADAEKFWADYMDEANVLLDSRKFEKECRDLGVDMVTFATHIVFLGKGMRDTVLKNGIKSTIGNDYILYKDKFVPDVAMQFVSDYSPEETKQSTETAA